MNDDQQAPTPTPPLYSLLVENIGWVINDSTDEALARQWFEEYSSGDHSQVTLWSTDSLDPIEEFYNEPITITWYWVNRRAPNRSVHLYLESEQHFQGSKPLSTGKVSSLYVERQEENNTFAIRTVLYQQWPVSITRSNGLAVEITCGEEGPASRVKWILFKKDESLKD